MCTERGNCVLQAPYPECYLIEIALDKDDAPLSPNSFSSRVKAVEDLSSETTRIPANSGIWDRPSAVDPAAKATRLLLRSRIGIVTRDREVVVIPAAAHVVLSDLRTLHPSNPPAARRRPVFLPMHQGQNLDPVGRTSPRTHLG